MVVVVDGKAGAQYDAIGQGSVLFSADGNHSAYVAHKGEKQLIVVDGQEGALYDGIPSRLPNLRPRRRAGISFKKRRLALSGQMEFHALAQIPLRSYNFVARGHCRR